MTKHLSKTDTHRTDRQGHTVCYFIRHAEAESVSHGGDAERALTKAGCHDAREIFALLAEVAPGIGHICTSPMMRARQTAELLASALRLDTEVEILPLLAGGGHAGQWIEILSRIKSDVKAVAAVGHEPLLGRWLGELCFGSSTPVVMKKCAIAKVLIYWEAHNIRAELHGLYQPGFMRKVARR